MYFPTGIKRELVRIFRTFCGGSATIHSRRRSISTLSHIKGITLDAGEKIHKVARRASGMSLDGTDKADDRD